MRPGPANGAGMLRYLTHAASQAHHAMGGRLCWRLTPQIRTTHRIGVNRSRDRVKEVNESSRVYVARVAFRNANERADVIDKVDNVPVGELFGARRVGENST